MFCESPKVPFMFHQLGLFKDKHQDLFEQLSHVDGLNVVDVNVNCLVIGIWVQLQIE